MFYFVDFLTWVYNMLYYGSFSATYLIGIIVLDVKTSFHLGKNEGWNSAVEHFGSALIFGVHEHSTINY